MDEIAPANRTDLAVAKEAGAGLRTEHLTDECGIVMRRTEEMAASPIAAKEE